MIELHWKLTQSKFIIWKNFLEKNQILLAPKFFWEKYIVLISKSSINYRLDINLCNVQLHIIRYINLYNTYYFIFQKNFDVKNIMTRKSNNKFWSSYF